MPSWTAATDAASVQKVAIVGTGIIGSGWSAVFLASGYSVTAYVRSASSAVKFIAAAEDAWQKLLVRGVATEADGLRNLRCVYTIEECVRDADYVQESVVEDLVTKQAIVAEIDRHCARNVLIGTSSSFLPFSLASLRCAVQPDRVVTAHPSLPQWDSFVEVIGPYPAQTAWLRELFTLTGMQVVSLTSENHGHVLNSLLQAMATTATVLTCRGVCSAADLDTATRHLAKLILAGEGFSGVFVGVVGGGSVDAAAAITVDACLGAPTAFAACWVSNCIGYGAVARMLTRLVQLLNSWYLASAAFRRLALALCKWALAPVFGRFVETSGASPDAARERYLRRVVALEALPV